MKKWKWGMVGSNDYKWIWEYSALKQSEGGIEQLPSWWKSLNEKRIPGVRFTTGYSPYVGDFTVTIYAINKKQMQKAFTLVRQTFGNEFGSSIKDMQRWMRRR